MCIVSSPIARAIAQDAPPTESAPAPEVEAQRLFRRGLELGEQDRWSEALELFRRSRALVERPSTLFNIGYALFRLGRFGEAVETFDAYLATPGVETSGLAAEAARRREEAQRSLATLTLELSPADARVAVDGDPRTGEGSPRTLALDPGRHVLRASAPDHEEAQLELSVLAAEAVTRSLTLTPIVREVIAPPITVVHETPIVEDPIFWGVTGGVIAAIAVAVGVGVGVATSATPAPYGGTTGVVLLAL